MRATSALFVVAFFAVPAFAQEVHTGTFRSDVGWAVTLPQGWKYVERGGTLVAGHDVEPGMLLVAFEPGATEETLRAVVRDGMPLEGVLFYARGPGRRPAGSAVFAADFDGVADDGTPLVAITASTLHGSGVVTVVGLTTKAQEKTLRPRIEQTARTVTFAKVSTTTAGGDVGALRGALCAYRGGSVASSTTRATFDGRGRVSLGSETAFGGSLTDQYGDEVARYGGGSGNQYAPTSGGRYRVEGQRVVIQWGDGTTTTCAIHMRQTSGQITELMCDGTLYASGLCE
jgi:hypothetical protein